VNAHVRPNNIKLGVDGRQKNQHFYGTSKRYVKATVEVATTISADGDHLIDT